MIAIPPAVTASYWQQQKTTDCVEETIRIAIAVHEHKQISQSRVDAYAHTAGYYTPGAGTGVAAIPKLLRHYGLKVHSAGPMSKATAEKDIAAGDSLIAIVNANTIWNTEGYWDGTTNTTTANHALTVDSIVGNWVEVTDTGIASGSLDLIPWAVFSKAWSASGWYGVAAS